MGSDNRRFDGDRKIGKCAVCSYLDVTPSKDKIGWQVRTCDATEQVIDNVTIIPEWCPLERVE